MAVKNYGIHDKWTDLDKLNNVDIKSVDGVIESVKINGEEAGGGGSSDFSTAQVTIVNTLEEDFAAVFPFLDDNVLRMANIDIGAGETQVLTMIIPTGGACVFSTFMIGTVSGDIAFEDGILTITGDGTFTVTGLD